MSPASRPHKHLVLAHDFWLAQVPCLLEMQVAYSEERPLAVGVSARKHRFIGQPALPPERDLFSRRLSVPAFRTICLFTLQATHTHTHTHTHTLTHTLLCTGWVGNASRREKPLTKMSASRRGSRSTQRRTIMITAWTCPCRGGKELPTCPSPTAVPVPTMA